MRFRAESGDFWLWEAVYVRVGADVVLTFCNATPAAEEVEGEGLASLTAEHAAGLPAPGRVAALCKRFCNTVAIVVAETLIPSFSSSPWIRT
jgi:hypothetical protein